MELLKSIDWEKLTALELRQIFSTLLHNFTTVFILRYLCCLFASAALAFKVTT